MITIAHKDFTMYIYAFRTQNRALIHLNLGRNGLS